MIINTLNNLDTLAQNSYISVAVSTGGTAIPVRNINPFITNYAIQIGKTGEEQTEILIVSGTTSGTSLFTSGTLRFDHPVDTPIFNIKYNKLIVKRSASGTAGTATALATVTITPDNIYTAYDDTSGATSYAYKTAYYNSTTTDTSSDSSWITPAGPSMYALQALRQSVKDDLFSADFIRSDAQINRWINQWIEQMNNAAIHANEDYAMGSTQVAFASTGLGTVTVANFKQPMKFELMYNSGTAYVEATKLPYNQYNPNFGYYSNAPIYSWTSDNTFIVAPHSTTGTANITYGKLPTALVNDSDELDYSLRGYTTGCLEYCLYKAYDLDQKETLSQSHYQKFLNSKSDFISEITPRDQGNPQFIEFVSPLGATTDNFFN